MHADEQLLTKQIIADALDALGSTTSIRFNLQRGKIARIWGFLWEVVNPVDNREYTLFVRKTQNAKRAETPVDLLWAAVTNPIVITSGGVNTPEKHIMFPKPYRTSGITVQQHASLTTTARGLLIIYYDIADVTKGELVQTWEKNISKGRTRRTITP